MFDFDDLEDAIEDAEASNKADANVEMQGAITSGGGYAKVEVPEAKVEVLSLCLLIGQPQNQIDS